MNQIIIGSFIARKRKEQGLTQMQLGQALGVTDRAVSKWERGKCLPDASCMLELCKLLHVDVNELLLGREVPMDEYDVKLQENLTALYRKQEESNRRALRSESIIGFGSSISFLVLMFAACFAVESAVWRAAMIAIAATMLLVGVLYCLYLEQTVGYYRCKQCGHAHIPSYRQVFFAPHIWRNRYMRCPHCHRLSMQKKLVDAPPEKIDTLDGK